MKKTHLKTTGTRWCEITVELKDGRLSVTGAEGPIVTHAEAKRLALDYWRTFFEDSPAEIMEMNKRFSKRFTSATGAARFVLEVDGELHGIDVHHSDGKTVLITESCGQIVSTLRRWFPEYVALLPWHLNDMKAGCEHQEAEGWDKRPIDPSKPLDAYGEFVPGRLASGNRLTGVSRREHPQGLMGEPCSTCGYKYGSAWLKRELPPEIIALAESVGPKKEAA